VEAWTPLPARVRQALPAVATALRHALPPKVHHTLRAAVHQALPAVRGLHSFTSKLNLSRV